MPALFGMALNRRRKLPLGLPAPFGNTRSCGWAFHSLILSLIFQTSFAGIGMNLSLADFFFLFALEPEMAPRFWLEREAYTFPN